MGPPKKVETRKPKLEVGAFSKWVLRFFWKEIVIGSGM